MKDLIKSLSAFLGNKINFFLLKNQIDSQLIQYLKIIKNLALKKLKMLF